MIRRLTFAAILVAFAAPVHADPSDNAPTRTVRDVKIEKIEPPHPGDVPGFPAGWGGGSTRAQDYLFGVAPAEGAAGKKAAYIKGRPGAAANAYFILMQCVKANDYVGKRMRLSARLKTIDTSAGQLFMRVDGPPPAKGEMTKVLAFDNMAGRPVRGTTDWQRYDVVLDVPDGAISICFGFTLVGGKGEVWGDDFALDAVSRNTLVTQGQLPKAPVNLSFDR